MPLTRKDLHRLKIEELTDYEKSLYEEFSEIVSEIYGEKIELRRAKILLDFLLASEEEKEKLNELMKDEGEATLAEASLKLMDHKEWKKNIEKGLRMMNKLIEKYRVRMVRLTQEIRDLEPAEIEALKKDPPAEVIEALKANPDSEVGDKEFTGRWIITLVVETGQKQVFLQRKG